MSSQFYLTASDVGKNRAEASCAQLSELNSYVRTTSYTGDLTEDFLKKFRVIVLADASDSEQHRIAKLAHENGIAFIIAESRGLFAKIFCDFGEKFTVYDTTGANPLSAMVASVTKDTEGVVTCLEETRHGFEDGDFITFSEVQGMTELNGCPPMKIKVLGPYTFSIGDTTKNSDYVRGGTAAQVKMPSEFSFKELSLAEKEPEFLITDFAKFDHADNLHVAFSVLHGFIAEHGKCPRPWNNEDAQKFLAACKSVKEDVKESLILQFAKTCSGDLCPLNAALGGYAAQEVMKACSGKFTPIKQFMYYDAIECLPENDLPEEEVQPQNSRYDAQIAIFGKSFQQKLGDAR